MSAQADREPRDYRPVSQGSGWIVQSATSGWHLGDNDSYYWFEDQAEASEYADLANNRRDTREVVAQAIRRMFRGGR